METLRSVSSLAYVLCRQNKLLEAEEISSGVLEDVKRTLGPDHPATFDCLANLGLLRQSQGRYEESILLYEQALTGRKMILGLEHPHTLDCQERWLEVAGKLKGRNEFQDPFEILNESSAEDTGWETAEEWKVLESSQLVNSQLSFELEAPCL